jgi:DNA polymerase III delta prime subunit
MQQSLESAIEMPDIGYLLFWDDTLYTGKTTSVHALARELLGPAYKDAVLELNASDARGIDVRTNVNDCGRPTLLRVCHK